MAANSGLHGNNDSLSANQSYALSDQLSDDQMEFYITGVLKRLLGLRSSDRATDSEIIGKFRKPPDSGRG